MPKRNRELLQNMDGGFFTEQDFYIISLYFENLKKVCAQSRFSELIDLHHYTIKRDEQKIRKELCNLKKTPFLFVCCLN